MVTHPGACLGLPTGTTVVASSLSGSDGSDGTACTASVTRVSRGSVCRVLDTAYERLYVVREGPDDRR
ncbi:hypothetical protein BRC60_04440 [Halobacteriales archaeon QH_1_68_42]|nr:MAG: hypothetical protein BRC60_04440 [Halobacteriales archaeon QH_1_68_42]